MISGIGIKLNIGEDMDIFDLNTEQKRAFNRLKKAYNDCQKAGIYFVNRYGSLHAYDENIINGFGDETMRANSDNEVSVYDATGDVNYMKIPGELSDDDGLHYYGLTEKGFKIYQNEAGNVFVPEENHETDEDQYIEFMLNQMTNLTEEEQKQKIKELNEGADYVIKRGISPNLDSIY